MELDPAFGHWLAGFIDGEGTFAIERCNPRTGRPSYSTRMALILRDDDAEVIEEIHRRTGIGRVFRKRRRPDGRPGFRATSNPQVGWIIQSKADCALLVDLLDHYPLRSKKARDYAIWREAVIVREEIASPGPPACDWSRMVALKDRLQAGRRYAA